MKISVKYLGNLRDDLGTEEFYDLFGDSNPRRLGEILAEMVQRKGETFARKIYEENGKFNPHITVILDGRAILNDQVMVQDGSSLLFIPFVDGG
jgi:molybdopterin converting factor small subunit